MLFLARALLSSIALQIFHLNVASAMTTMMLTAAELGMMTEIKNQVSSKAQIMETMTTESAARTLIHMNSTRARPEFAALIETKFGHMLKRSRSLRSKDRHHDDLSQLQSLVSGLHSGKSQPTGYAAVEKANKMISDMLMETAIKFESESKECTEFNSTQLDQLERTSEAVYSFNSQAAESRGRVLRAQGELNLLNVQLPQVRSELLEHNEQCDSDIAALKGQLAVVLADIEIMDSILNQTQCNDATATATSLLLVQCAHCGGAVMIQHEKIQPLLSKLGSPAAAQLLKRNLDLAYQESLAGQAPIALAQEGVTHMRRIVQEDSASYKLRHSSFRRHREEAQNPPAYALNVSDVPVNPEPSDCIPTTKCSIGSSPNCERLRDRFLVIQTGIVDRKRELNQAIVDMEKYCKEERESYEAQIIGMEERHAAEQTNLAVATTDQNSAEAGSHLKAKQHKDLVTEYQTKMEECCNNQNTMRSETCALEKIRGELNKMEGLTTFITDCEVSDWQEELCSVTCGGGTMRKTRSVITHPIGDGMPCLPLTMAQNCNMEACPIDCQMDDWGGWSACSAECGGGVRERTRPILVPAEHMGTPCETTEEEETCGMGDCNPNCLLSVWSEWSTCSKMCNEGKQRRSKSIKEKARGTGICWGPEDEERLEFKDCNTFGCEELLPMNRAVVKCNSKVDLVILLDGSGSLGRYGWQQSVATAQNIVEQMKGGDDKVKVSLQLFSGPKTMTDYYACTRDSNGVNMEAQCGISWVSHFSDDMPALSDTVGNLAWPRATTLTSVALGEAGSEFTYGRQDANSVVVVITDGWPLSIWNTYIASRNLQKKARVIWVPVGRNAPLELIHHMASKPESEHIIPVRHFGELGTAKMLNQLISTTCPLVE